MPVRGVSHYKCLLGLASLFTHNTVELIVFYHDLCRGFVVSDGMISAIKILRMKRLSKVLELGKKRHSYRAIADEISNDSRFNLQYSVNIYDYLLASS